MSDYGFMEGFDYQDKYDKIRRETRSEAKVLEVMKQDGITQRDIDRYFRTTKRPLPSSVPGPRKVVDTFAPITIASAGKKNQAILRKLVDQTLEQKKKEQQNLSLLEFSEANKKRELELESQKHLVAKKAHYSLLGTPFSPRRGVPASLMIPNQPAPKTRAPVPTLSADLVPPRRKSDFAGELSLAHLLSEKGQVEDAAVAPAVKYAPATVDGKNSAFLSAMLSKHQQKKRLEEKKTGVKAPTKAEEAAAKAAALDHKARKVAHLVKIGAVYAKHKESPMTQLSQDPYTRFQFLKKKEKGHAFVSSTLVSAVELPDPNGRKSDFELDASAVLEPHTARARNEPAPLTLPPVAASTPAGQTHLLALLQKNAEKVKQEQDKLEDMQPIDRETRQRNLDLAARHEAEKVAHYGRLGAAFTARVPLKLDPLRMRPTTAIAPVDAESLPAGRLSDVAADFTVALAPAPAPLPPADVLPELLTASMPEDTDKKKTYVKTRQTIKNEVFLKHFKEEQDEKKEAEHSKRPPELVEAIKEEMDAAKKHNAAKLAHYKKLGANFARHVSQARKPTREEAQEGASTFLPAFLEGRKSDFAGDYSNALRKTPPVKDRAVVTAQEASLGTFLENLGENEAEILKVVQAAQSVIPPARGMFPPEMVKAPLKLAAKNEVFVTAVMKENAAKKQVEKDELKALPPKEQQAKIDARYATEKRAKDRLAHYARIGGSLASRQIITSNVAGIQGDTSATPNAVVSSELYNKPRRRISAFEGDFQRVTPEAEPPLKEESVGRSKAELFIDTLIAKHKATKADQAAALAQADPAEAQRVEQFKYEHKERDAKRKQYFKKMGLNFATFSPVAQSVVSGRKEDKPAAAFDAGLPLEGRRSSFGGDYSSLMRRSLTAPPKEESAARDAAVEAFFTLVREEEKALIAQQAEFDREFNDNVKRARSFLVAPRMPTGDVKQPIVDHKSAPFARAMLDNHNTLRAQDKELMAKFDPEGLKKKEATKDAKKAHDDAKKAHYASLGAAIVQKPTYVSNALAIQSQQAPDLAAKMINTDLAPEGRKSQFANDFSTLLRRTPPRVYELKQGDKSAPVAKKMVEQLVAEKSKALQTQAADPKLAEEKQYEDKVVNVRKAHEGARLAHYLKFGAVFAPHRPVVQSLIRTQRPKDHVGQRIADDLVTELVPEGRTSAFKADWSTALDEIRNSYVGETKEENWEREGYMEDYVRALLAGEDDEMRMNAMAKARKVRTVIPKPRAAAAEPKGAPGVQADSKNAPFIKTMLEKHVARKQAEMANLSPEEREEKLASKTVTGKHARDKIAHFSKLGSTFRPPPSGVVQVSALMLNKPRKELERHVAKPPKTAEVFHSADFGPIVDDKAQKIPTAAASAVPKKVIKVDLPKLEQEAAKKSISVAPKKSSLVPGTISTLASGGSYAKLMDLLRLIGLPVPTRRAAPVFAPRVAQKRIDSEDKFAKYRNLLRMNFTKECVQERMARDGFAKRDIDAFFQPMTQDPRAQAERAALAQANLKAKLAGMRVAPATSVGANKAPVHVKKLSGATPEVRNEEFFRDLLEKHLLAKRGEQAKLAALGPEEQSKKAFAKEREQKHREQKIRHLTQMGQVFAQKGPRGDKKEAGGSDEDESNDIVVNGRQSVFAGNFDSLLRSTRRFFGATVGV